MAADAPVLELLQPLGVSLLTEWDTLAFLYNHSPCLATPVEIAGLIGYGQADIAAALRELEQLGLIERSRNDQGRRLYRCSKTLEPARHSCFLELMRLARNRTGRLALLKYLKRPRQVRRARRDGGLRLA